MLSGLGELDETAELCRDRDSNPEPAPELHDTKTVSLKDCIEDYFKREIDHDKTKVSYDPAQPPLYRYETIATWHAEPFDIRSHLYQFNAL